VPTLLSEHGFFTWDSQTGFTFREDVIPYDLNTPLFSDYALKQRAVYIPPGTSATFDPEQPFDLPVGSVVIKSFYFPADFRAPTANLRIVETRLLVREESGWVAHPYIWNEEQTDAVLSPSGEIRDISFIDAEGTSRVSHYLIPQRNQCQSCHARKPTLDSPAEIVLIGIKARHLHRTYDYGGTVGVRNQLTYLAERGVLTGLPALDTITPAYDFREIEANGIASIPSGELDHAARSYLDINCAHCHNPNGVQGITSQLYLNHDNVDLFRLGYCKRPGSAGLGTGGFSFDITPGTPDTSILYFRLHTEEVGAIMPLLGRSVTHTRGSELIHAWIDAMPDQVCN
jgi:uncharacterized repeat protein (TIGR03806 family)